MHTSIEELKALSSACASAPYDPDTVEYPDLFVTHTFSDDEMGAYGGNPFFPFEDRDCEQPQIESNFTSGYSHQRLQTNLEVFSVTRKTVSDHSLKAAGWKRRKNASPVTYLEPLEWIDTQTGEIVTKAEARKRGVTAPVSISLRMIKTQGLLRRCSPKKRDFLDYILRIRNKRGGLIVDLRTAIDRWIAYKHPQMDSTDRARRRKSYEGFLYEKGIMADGQTLTRDFQLMAFTTKKDHLGEASRFLTVLPIPSKPGRGFLRETTPEPA